MVRFGKIGRRANYWSPEPGAQVDASFRPDDVFNHPNAPSIAASTIEIRFKQGPFTPIGPSPAHGNDPVVPAGMRDRTKIQN